MLLSTFSGESALVNEYIVWLLIGLPWLEKVGVDGRRDLEAVRVHTAVMLEFWEGDELTILN